MRILTLRTIGVGTSILCHVSFVFGEKTARNNGMENIQPLTKVQVPYACK